MRRSLFPLCCAPATPARPACGCAAHAAAHDVGGRLRLERTGQSRTGVVVALAAPRLPWLPTARCAAAPRLHTHIHTAASCLAASHRPHGARGETHRHGQRAPAPGPHAASAKSLRRRRVLGGPPRPCVAWCESTRAPQPWRETTKMTWRAWWHGRRKRHPAPPRAAPRRAPCPSRAARRNTDSAAGGFGRNRKKSKKSKPRFLRSEPPQDRVARAAGRKGTVGGGDPRTRRGGGDRRGAA